MKIRLKANVKIAEDNDEEIVLFAPDDDSAEVVLLGPQECSCGRVAIAALGTYTLPLGSVAIPSGLFIKSDGDFGLVLNGGSSLAIAREVKTASGGTKAASAKFLMEGTVSSAVITAGASAITLIFALFGDPAA